MSYYENVYNKTISGDPLTDQEVKMGRAFFKNLADGLIGAGPVFRLAFKEANQIFMTLDDYQRARAGK